MILDISINWHAFFEWIFRGFLFGFGFMSAIGMFIYFTRGSKK